MHSFTNSKAFTLPPPIWQILLLVLSPNYQLGLNTNELPLITGFVNFQDQWGLQDLHSLKGHNTITLDSNVTHLGYGEVFVEQFGTVAKKRYLFTFGLDSSSKRYYEIVINPEDLSIETG